MFLRGGLDRANQLESVQEIKFFAQILGAVSWARASAIETVIFIMTMCVRPIHLARNLLVRRIG
jgi:hypothetical protein